MRIMLSAILSIGVVVFSLDWFNLFYQGIEPKQWQISFGLVLISLVLLKSSMEEMFLWSKERKEKKNEKEALIAMHERMSTETAKLYAKVKEEERKEKTQHATSLGSVLKENEKVATEELELVEVVEVEERKVAQAH